MTARPAGRAAETLADGLADGEVMDRCRQLGGVCIPHMRTAAASAPRHIVTWLADTLREAASAPTAGPGWLAGADRDAEARAVLRHEVPPSGTPLPGACVVCLAAAQAERDCLAASLARLAAKRTRGQASRSVPSILPISRQRPRLPAACGQCWPGRRTA